MQKRILIPRCTNLPKVDRIAERVIRIRKNPQKTHINIPIQHSSARNIDTTPVPYGSKFYAESLYQVKILISPVNMEVMLTKKYLFKLEL